jgi:predicted transcriptional regulator
MLRDGPAEIPPPLELECLKALWTLGEGNVRAVRQELMRARPLAYTTVMTVLDRLARRGAVARRKAGRSFLYTPLLSRHTLRGLAVRQLLDGFFDGSEDELRAYLEGRQPAPECTAPEPELDTALL